MGTGWRLVRAARAGSAFSGEGAKLFGGRWNSPGVPMVYTSSSLSLASLEILVHVQPLTPRDLFVVFRVEWKDRQMAVLTEEDLPVGWRMEPPPIASMQVGDRWSREKRSVVLAVPSVLVPEEKNFLLNPFHPGFAQLKIVQTRTFTFDPRLQG